MTKAAETSDTARRAAERIDYLRVIDANGANLDAVMKASDAMLKGMAAVGQEMVEFTNTQLRQGIETSHSLMGCSDMGQAFGLQCNYARKATQQYLQEASRMMGLAAEITRESWAPLEARAKQTLNRLNGR